MAYRTGVSQSELMERFSINETVELFAWKKIEHGTPSKEDKRTQLLGYWLTCSNAANANDVDPAAFEMPWLKEPIKPVKMSEEELLMWAKSKAEAHGGVLKIEVG